MTSLKQASAGWAGWAGCAVWAAWPAVLLLLLCGCAALLPAPGPEGRSAVAVLEIAGEPFEALWQLPAPALGEPAAVLLLQHGYARRCSHLQTTARQIMAQGLVVLCINASMAGGNAPLADALAAVLAGGLTLPDGRPLPARLVVGGHSAGAAFAARVGARFAALAPQRLAGALLLDPVAVRGFGADLQAISAGGQRPVLAIASDAGPCNAQRSADAALLALGGFVGVALQPGASHMDAEGDDGEGLAQTLCGRPLPASVARLRALAAAWAAELARGVAPTVPQDLQAIR
jgi:pimeloyl-ACP methyl ester carboxylesterase